MAKGPVNGAAPASTMDILKQNCKFVCVYGAPASGKSTMCHMLVDDADVPANIYHLSVDAYLHELNAAGNLPDTVASSLAAQTAAFPPDLVPLLEQKMLHEYEQNGFKVFLLDGFPLDKAQFDWFMQFYSLQTQLAIFMDCAENVALARYLARGRSSDTTLTFATRYEEFEEEIEGLLDPFQPERLVAVDQITNATLSPAGVYEHFKEQLADHDVAGMVLGIN